MKALVAYDKFKDALTAHEACSLTAQVLEAVHPEWEVVCAPLADGGEGFAKILTEANKGQLKSYAARDPYGRQIEVAMGWTTAEALTAETRELAHLPETGKIAIAEMALPSGLARLPAHERDLWKTSTLGTGDLLMAAAEEGAAAILLGIGGSATCDLGLGALETLGLQALDANGLAVSPLTPENFHRIARFEWKGYALPPIRIACDVQNPLLGVSGTAAVYGPQKGLRAQDLPKLEAELARVAALLAQTGGKPANAVEEPASGAAGGIGYGLKCLCEDVRYIPGFDFVWSWLRLESHLADADLIITGEGRFDSSSLQGKGPGTLVAKAIALKKQCLIVAGQIEEGLPLPKNCEGIAITPPEVELARALKLAPLFMREALVGYFQGEDAQQEF